MNVVLRVVTYDAVAFRVRLTSLVVERDNTQGHCSDVAVFRFQLLFRQYKTVATLIPSTSNQINFRLKVAAVCRFDSFKLNVHQLRGTVLSPTLP